MKTYIIQDINGKRSEWTARTLADKLNCSVSCARQRLISSQDPKKLFAPIGESLKLKYKKKTYELTEDDKVVFTGTAIDIAITYKLCESTVYSRLRKGDRDVKTICKTPNNSRHSSAGRALPATKTSDIIKSRNFFDPMSRLLLKVC